MNCPRCGESDCFVKNTRILPTGKRKRRYGCQVCEYRWTVYEKIEGAEVKVPIKRAGPPPRRMFMMTKFVKQWIRLNFTKSLRTNLRQRVNNSFLEVSAVC